MLLSMTGYGRAIGSFGDKSIVVELRSLNSKVTDIKIRIPGEYRDKESEIRKLITDHAERGKVDINIDLQNSDGAAPVSLNEPLFRGYYLAISKLADELGLDKKDILTSIMRIPSVMGSQGNETDEEEWVVLRSIISEALEALKLFRQEEGKVIEQDLRLRIKTITDIIETVTPFEQERFVRMRERMRNNMEEVFGRENLDSNRFEQEVLYYLEKMDMSEEKIRLSQHCKYFLEQVDDSKLSAGRTLGFITQEMGREINTLGAKAYDANIQRFVVQMKDELEKIKEQIANVL
ncbi:MAG: hypothetical protein RIR11_1322 [Bacteroidota bacterium]|jgi:uncharacterized protein (TIGR00255 family)